MFYCFVDYFIATIALVFLIGTFVRTYMITGKIISFFLIAKSRVLQWICVCCFLYFISFIGLQSSLEAATRTWTETTELRAGEAVRLNKRLHITAERKSSFVWRENGTNKIVTVKADIQGHSDFAMDVLSYVKRVAHVPGWVRHSKEALFTDIIEKDYIFYIKECP